MNMTVLNRSLALALLLAATAVSTPSMAQSAAPVGDASKIPAEHFFRKPAIRNPTLSPNGKKIAMLVPTQSGRVGLAVADVSAPNKFVGIAQFDDADVRQAQWVNDNRLVFDAIDFQAPVGDQHGSGLYAVNADGSDYVWLIKRTYSYSKTGATQSVNEPLRVNYVLHSVPLDGSDDVFVDRYDVFDRGDSGTSTTLMRLNTRSMTLRRAYPDAVPEGVQRWVLDPDLQARALVTFDGKRTRSVYWRAVASSDWTKLDSMDEFDESGRGWEPLGVDRSGHLYVSARNTDSKDGTTSLYRYDVAERKLADKPLVSVPGFDFEGRLILDRGTKQLLGIRYEQEAAGVAWLDKGMRELQAGIDAQLKSTNNLIGCLRCTEATHVVVTATSDVQPPVYFLYDRAKDKLSLLGASMPWIDSRQMAAQDFHRIKARDGMEFPVYVTKPKGQGPWPAIVLIHGGPYVRGVQWGFSPDVQFLASRGYLVIEPEYRGSTGYGDKLFKAGWKQWGLKMQDDMTDATRWAIAQGWADKDRIAIAGASYGGYATMMGLVKEPELYKAGINWVGVTDIELMYTIGWSDFMDPDNPWVRYGMPRMIGDPRKDGEQLKATSPLQQAKRITRPVLMAYGEEDRRVPLPHGTKMRDALLDAGNKNVEWVQYEGEGHGFMLTRNNVDFWTRVERFLARNLK